MKNLLSVLFLCLGMSSLAQNEFSKWYFGRYTGLDFMSTPPSVINHTTMYTFEGCASVADGAGDLLFYTDGMTIWNKHQLVMANGTGLLGSGSTVQAALIVKQPGNQNIYYVFTLDLQGGPNGLRYSLVDMSLAAGTGSVTVKNATVTTPCTEQLTGTRHCNGIDMWIVTHDFSGNNFKSFLLTSAGLNLSPVVSSLGPVAPTFTPNNMVGGQGSIKISPSGKKLGLTFYNGSNNSEVAMFDFDRSTGVVSNYLSLITGTLNFYGCEFSGDGTKFYAASFNGNPKVLYQWDVCAGSNALLLASMNLVGTSPAGAGQMQLAPDGRIYFTVGNTQTISTINNPDLAGTACNYMPMAMSVATGSNGSGLPNFYGGAIKILPQFSYSVNPQVSCFTASFSAPAYTTGCAASAYSVQSLLWNFGQPSSGASNTSTLTGPIHNYGASGDYTVKLIFQYQCGADTIYQKISIPGPSLAVMTNSCASTATLTIANGTGPFTYTWLPSAQTTSVANVSTGTYSINVTDGNNCPHSALAQISSFPSPTIAVQNVTTCPQTIATLVASGATSYTWSPGNNNGATYTASPASTQVYTVAGSYTNGCSSKTTVTLTILNCSSVNEESGDKGVLKIYPNPVTNEFFVESKEQVEIVISDRAGREILRRQLDKGVNKIDADVLQPGIYFLNVPGKSGYMVNKIIRVE